MYYSAKHKPNTTCLYPILSSLRCVRMKNEKASAKRKTTLTFFCFTLRAHTHKNCRTGERQKKTCIDNEHDRRTSRVDSGSKILSNFNVSSKQKKSRSLQVNLPEFRLEISRTLNGSLPDFNWKSPGLWLKPPGLTLKSPGLWLKSPELRLEVSRTSTGSVPDFDWKSLGLRLEVSRTSIGSR